MINKKDIKSVAVVMAGVLAAGYFMSMFSEIGIVDGARAGYGA